MAALTFVKEYLSCALLGRLAGQKQQGLNGACVSASVGATLILKGGVGISSTDKSVWKLLVGLAASGRGELQHGIRPLALLLAKLMSSQR